MGTFVASHSASPSGSERDEEGAPCKEHLPVVDLRERRPSGALKAPAVAWGRHTRRQGADLLVHAHTAFVVHGITRVIELAARAAKAQVDLTLRRERRVGGE